jgi:hypothetical protein
VIQHTAAWTEEHSAVVISLFQHQAAICDNTSSNSQSTHPRIAKNNIIVQQKLEVKQLATAPGKHVTVSKYYFEVGRSYYQLTDLYTRKLPKESRFN